jgi:hypothetical protein
MTRITLIIICLLSFNSFVFSQVNESTCYFFGHSLIDHRPPINPTPSDETTVPHWLQLLANHANKDFSASGKYGFLPQHATQTVFSQWGYDIVNSAWESDYEDFSVADFSTIFITAGNFIQWQSHTEDYYNDPGISPLSATLDIIDYVAAQEDSLKIVIYENWPDMGGIAPDFPPTDNQLETYYNYTVGDFHDWWLAYHNDLDSNRPELDVKMIPVGIIFADLFTNSNLSQIPSTELYEDNAPHGRASLYFLASLVSYVGIYEEKPPVDFDIPEIVHPIIIENYSSIIEKIWETCVEFNFEDGRNRVFTIDPVSANVENQDEQFSIYPNPASDKIIIETSELTGSFRLTDMQGKEILNGALNGSVELNTSHLSSGVYFIQITTVDNLKILRKVVVTN